MFENGDKNLSRNYAKVKSFDATTDGSSMCSELQDILKKRKKKLDVPIGAIKKQA